MSNSSTIARSLLCAALAWAFVPAPPQPASETALYLRGLMADQKYEQCSEWLRGCLEQYPGEDAPIECTTTYNNCVDGRGAVLFTVAGAGATMEDIAEDALERGGERGLLYASRWDAAPAEGVAWIRLILPYNASYQVRMTNQRGLEQLRSLRIYRNAGVTLLVIDIEELERGEYTVAISAEGGAEFLLPTLLW